MAIVIHSAAHLVSQGRGRVQGHIHPCATTIAIVARTGAATLATTIVPVGVTMIEIAAEVVNMVETMTVTVIVTVNHNDTVIAIVGQESVLGIVATLTLRDFAARKRGLSSGNEIESEKRRKWKRGESIIETRRRWEIEKAELVARGRATEIVVVTEIEVEIWSERTATSATGMMTGIALLSAYLSVKEPRVGKVLQTWPA